MKSENISLIPARTHVRTGIIIIHRRERSKSYPSVTSAQLQIECKQANRTEPNRTEARQSIRNQEISAIYAATERLGYLFKANLCPTRSGRLKKRVKQAITHPLGRPLGCLIGSLSGQSCCICRQLGSRATSRSHSTVQHLERKNGRTE